MLSERQKLILSAVVDDYIRFAEPVGSRSISKRGDVGFSPATIRNEMSDLEELGFLEQPKLLLTMNAVSPYLLGENILRYYRKTILLKESNFIC